MPRPYPPTLLGVPEVKRFDIDASNRQRLARALGLTTLHPDLGGAIAHAIACLLATRAGSRDTTVGATLAALPQLCRPGRASDAVVARLDDDRYGIDYTTHNRLQPLAHAAMSGDTEARTALELAARDGLRSSARIPGSRRTPRRSASFVECCGQYSTLQRRRLWTGHGSTAGALPLKFCPSPRWSTQTSTPTPSASTNTSEPTLIRRSHVEHPISAPDYPR